MSDHFWSIMDWKQRYQELAAEHEALLDKVEYFQLELEKYKEQVLVANRGIARLKYKILAQAKNIARAKNELNRSTDKRGVTHPCEKCNKLEGAFKDNGFWRCNACGYPSK